jgi:hypothetical protein
MMPKFVNRWANTAALLWFGLRLNVHHLLNQITRNAFAAARPFSFGPDFLGVGRPAHKTIWKQDPN